MVGANYTIDTDHKTATEFSISERDLLGTGSLKDVRPLVRIVEFRLEHRCKISVGEMRWIVVLHKLDKLWVMPRFPIVPEPLRAHARYREHAPVKKDAYFGFIVPLWKRA